MLVVIETCYQFLNQLVAAQALEGISEKDISTTTLQANWDALLRDLDPTTAQLNEIFLR